MAHRARRVAPALPRCSTLKAHRNTTRRHATWRTGQIRELRAQLTDKDTVIEDLRRRLDERAPSAGKRPSG